MRVLRRLRKDVVTVVVRELDATQALVAAYRAGSAASYNAIEEGWLVYDYGTMTRAYNRGLRVGPDPKARGSSAMKLIFIFTALTLMAVALPSNLRAVRTVLDDHKIGPPGRCTQQFLGFHDLYGRMGRSEKPTFIALNDIDGHMFSAREPMDDSSTAWALRAQRMKAILSPSHWHRLENSWDRYVSARTGAALAVERICTGEELASSFGIDLLYLVGAPFEIAGAISEGAEGNWKEMFTYMVLPVGAAIGLATDSIFTITLPMVKLSARLRAYRTAKAFKRFTVLVVELEEMSTMFPRG